MNDDEGVGDDESLGLPSPRGGSGQLAFDEPEVDLIDVQVDHPVVYAPLADHAQDAGEDPAPILGKKNGRPNTYIGFRFSAVSFVPEVF